MEISNPPSKRNTVMNQMILLRQNAKPNSIPIPDFVDLSNLKDDAMISDKAKIKKIAKFKFEDLKRKILMSIMHPLHKTLISKIHRKYSFVE